MMTLLITLDTGDELVIKEVYSVRIKDGMVRIRHQCEDHKCIVVFWSDEIRKMRMSYR